MCEPETKVPQPQSPSPSQATPQYQLQPSTPEISTRYASNPNLLKRMQESICFKCREKGHWSWYCPLNSPNNNNNNNLSPVSTKRILCRCGHGFCDVKTAHSSNNWGRDYFVCPIRRNHRSCGYRVSEDEVLNNTSVVPMPEDELLNNRSIVPIRRQSRQRTLHEFWEDQNETADNNLGEGAGGDLSVTPKRMRVIDNSESSSPMALSQIPEEKDGGIG